jgi:hypothetical protein
MHAFLKQAIEGDLNITPTEETDTTINIFTSTIKYYLKSISYIPA